MTAKEVEALVARVLEMPVRDYGGPLGRGVMMSGEDRDALCAAVMESLVFRVAPPDVTEGPFFRGVGEGA